MRERRRIDVCRASHARGRGHVSEMSEALRMRLDRVGALYNVVCLRP
jgi:hypothetical protein